MGCHQVYLRDPLPDHQPCHLSHSIGIMEEIGYTDCQDLDNA